MRMSVAPPVIRALSRCRGVPLIPSIVTLSVNTRLLTSMSGGDYDQLERVIAYARQRYTEAVMKCAEAMTEALEGTNFRVSGFLGQREVFAEHVSRSGRELKTAYMLVDALRFEMARELIDGLGEGFEAQLLPVAAQLPTITDVGMAASVARSGKKGGAGEGRAKQSCSPGLRHGDEGSGDAGQSSSLEGESAGCGAKAQRIDEAQA